jgi:hypothetical protein
MHRFLLDNDSSNIFHHPIDDLDATLAEVVRECPAQVTTYLLCSGAGCCYWPTRIGHVDPRATALVEAHARGVDPLRLLLEQLKAAGKEVFLSYRMNDVHNPTDADQWNTPRVRLEHPDCIVGLDEVKRGDASWMSYCMDYARDDVRAYVLELIEEQIALYGDLIDGFQLDWMRFPRHLSGTPEEVWAKREIVTDFVGRVRAILATAGRPISLAARVPTTPAGCRQLGFDIAAWAAQGMLDLLVICPFLTTEWQVPVAPFRDLMGERQVPIYSGFDFGFGHQVHFPESLRGICSSLYDTGADGIYVFNFPCWTEYLAARPYHWLDGLDTPAGASKKPLLLAADHRRHRVEGVDQSALLPATLAGGETLSVPLYIPASTLPTWRCLALVQSHGDVRLRINQQPGLEIRHGRAHSGPFRSEILLEYANQYGDADDRPQPADCRTFQIPPDHLVAGDNQVLIENTTAAPLAIERLNLVLW